MEIILSRFSSENNVEFMDAEYFGKLLNMAKTTNRSEITIYGGDCLFSHPEKEKIITYINNSASFFNADIRFIINELEDVDFVYRINEKIKFKFDITNWKNFKEQSKDNLRQYLVKKNNDKIDLKYSVGYDWDFSFLWKLVHECSINTIDLSVISPSNINEFFDKKLFYKKIKPCFIKLIKESLIEDAGFNLVGNQIPPCFFTSQEIVLIMNAINNKDINSLTNSIHGIFFMPNQIVSLDLCNNELNSFECQLDSIQSFDNLFKKIDDLHKDLIKGNYNYFCLECELMKFKFPCGGFYMFEKGVK